MSRNKVLLALAATLTLITIPSDGPGVLRAASSSSPSIVGSWIIAPAAPAIGRRPSIPNLLTFASDSTATGFSGFGHEVGRIGVWRASPDGAVTYTFMAIHNSPAGEFAELWKIRGKVTLSPAGDAFAGGGRTDVFDAQKKLVRSFTFTNHATRIKVEAP